MATGSILQTAAAVFLLLLAGIPKWHCPFMQLPLELTHSDGVQICSVTLQCMSAGAVFRQRLTLPLRSARIIALACITTLKLDWHCCCNCTLQSCVLHIKLSCRQSDYSHNT